MTKRLTWAFVTAVLLTALTNAPADARHHHKRHHYTHVHIAPVIQDDRYPSQGVRTQARAERRVQTTYDSGNVIGGRPSGCPHAYCGCGARLYLGIADTRLNLAWNWTKYYHGSTPVAVWHHHVAIVIRMTGPKTALMRDYNGGRGLSYIHERSTAGARIVGSTFLAMR